VVAKVAFWRQRVQDADIVAGCLQLVLPVIGGAVGFLLLLVSGAPLDEAVGAGAGAAVVVLALQWWTADEQLLLSNWLASRVPLVGGTLLVGWPLLTPVVVSAAISVG
jgi:hypothetical protein